MILTTGMLLEKLHNYQDPFGKIRRMCENKELIPVAKGIYETSAEISGYVLANVIYGPAYLSFDYALARYGLIPEAVYEYTSATCQKGKKKLFTNYFGTYSYRDVPVQAFAAEVTLVEENGYAYWLAGPEKALCDKLYSLPRLKNRREMAALLSDDLRLAEVEFSQIRTQVVAELAPLYHCHNVSLLAGMLRRSGA